MEGPTAHATSPRVLLQQDSKAKEKEKKAEAKVPKATGISLVETATPPAMATTAIPGTQDGSRILSSTTTRIQTAIGVKAAKANEGVVCSGPPVHSRLSNQHPGRHPYKTRLWLRKQQKPNQANRGAMGIPWEGRKAQAA